MVPNALRPMMPRQGLRIGIVLVNWKRATDTIECLESVLRSTIPVHVVVVDNDSGDGSMDDLLAWAAGTLAPAAADEAMAFYTQPPLPKPINVRRFSSAEAAATPPLATSGSALTLIDAGGNVGFAAGNNIGLRHLLGDPGLDLFWLLNNDTIIAPDTAEALVRRMRGNPRIGMCGTVVRFYFRPDTVQAFNGHRFSWWTGSSRGLGAGGPLKQPHDPATIARQTDFVLGASLAVTRAFLETIGPMAEDYFLYYEEIDWAARNAGRFAIGFAHGATVFHKEGGSIGSSSQPGSRSATSDYWLTRSRLKFIRRHRPILLPLHWLITLGLIARRLQRRQPDKARVMLRALAGLPK